MPIPPPTSLRPVLELLKFYREEVGPGPIFQAVGGETWTVREMFYAIHGRRPDSLSSVLNTADNPAFNIFRETLYSDEFRKQHPPRILQAYPEKKRLFFVHIPKSAGSDLASHLTSRFPTLNTRLCQREWADNQEFLQALKEFTLETPHSDTIFVTGHNHLALYEDWNILRFEDRIFTVLREPISQIISQVNYVLTRIFSDEFPPAPDTKGWRERFGVDDLKIEHSPEEMRALGRRILVDSQVTIRNVMTAYIGGGIYEKAIERIAIHNVELVDLSTYERWCREEWGITYSRRVNESKRYLSRADFEADMDYVMAATDVDRRLHGDLVRALAVTGTASVKGIAFIYAAGIAPRIAPAPPNLPPSPALNPPADTKPAEVTDAQRTELMEKFESLGENCELGLVQRRCGVEPLGLLRFASAPLPKLLDALRKRFEGMGKPENIEVQLSGNGREYMILDKAFGLLYHAWVSVGDKTPAEIQHREARRVPFLVRKLIEDLTEGEKIFVFHGMTPLTLHDATELSDAVQAYGPACLLWVELANREDAAGTVKWVAPGVLQGFVDRFAPGENAHDLSLDCWVSVCGAALACEQMGSIAKVDLSMLTEFSSPDNS